MRGEALFVPKWYRSDATMRNGPLIRADRLANNQVVWLKDDAPRGPGRRVQVCRGARRDRRSGRGRWLRRAQGFLFFVPRSVTSRLSRLGRAQSPCPTLTPMFGAWTAIDVAAGLFGGIRTLIGARLSEGMRDTAMHSIGLVTLLVGVQTFLRFYRTSTQLVLNRKGKEDADPSSGCGETAPARHALRAGLRRGRAGVRGPGDLGDGSFRKTARSDACSATPASAS